jgi:hypothetical protein
MKEQIKLVDKELYRSKIGLPIVNEFIKNSLVVDKFSLLDGGRTRGRSRYSVG